MLGNAFGHFGSAGKAFHITRADTPMPWTNVVCNGRYGFVVSQNGGGFSWYDNSQLNVLTRWDMDMVQDRTGRFLLLSDLDEGSIWSIAPAPTFPEYDAYECVHEPGRTTFRTQHAGISAEWVLAVASDDPIEVWRVSICNTSERPRRLRLSSYLEWCCGAAPDAKREFHRLFLTTRHDPTRRAIIATKNMWEVPVHNPKEHWAKPWPYAAAHALLSGEFARDLATADKSLFLGNYRRASTPAGMLGDVPERRFGRFSDPCAAIGGDFEIAPGETKTFSFGLCITTLEEDPLGLIDRYRGESSSAAVMESAPAFWDSLLGGSRVECADDAFSAMNNTWLAYQAISGRLWARTGYYQQSGAFGFRDQLQDSQVWLLRDPTRCAEQIRLHARHQFADGSVYHWWHPLTEMGLTSSCSDDYLWLPFVVARYLNETGSLDLLRSEDPFVDDERPATLTEHCMRAFERCFSRFGAHGMPLIGAMDWNDGLSAVGVEERGESVWLAQFLAGLLADWSLILERIGEKERAEAFSERRDLLIRSINEHAWDGEWYRRATTDEGEWLGSSRNQHGRIFLNAQTWAILNETGPADRLKVAWGSVREHLLREMGPLLLAPAYQTPDPSIGYITRYCPGARENGGVYMHAAMWALAAASKMGDAEAVGAIWHSICPPRRSAEDARRYQAEPYVTPGNVDGPDSDLPGKAGWTWYTGSAAWLNRVCIEWVLGVRAEWEGLLVDPRPFPELGKVRLKRVWRGRTLMIHFDSTEFVTGGRVTLNIDGNVLPNLLTEEMLPPPGDEEISVHVKWTLGVHQHASEPKPPSRQATIV